MKGGIFRGWRPFAFILALALLTAFALTAFAAQSREEPRPKTFKRPWYHIFQINMDKYTILQQDVPYVPIMDYSEACSLCHARYYSQWQSSRHGRSFVDPFFQQGWIEYREFYDREVQEVKDARRLGEAREGQELPVTLREPQRIDCTSCHAPAVNTEIEYSQNRPLKEFLIAMREGYVPRIEDVVSGNVEQTLGVRKEPWPHSDIDIRDQLNYWQRLNDYVKDGVSCDYCHTITRMGLPTDRAQIAFPEMYNQYYGLSYEHRFGQQKFGPIAEGPTSGHTRGYSAVFSQSVFCAPCHQEVNGYGVVVQDTYNEWLKSDYSHPGSSYKTCQDCHMPTVSSLGMAPVPPSKHGPDRPDAHMHDLRGTTPAMLQTAAELALNVEKEGGTVKATVDVTNNGTGHMLPTGLPYHQVVLVVRGLDADGDVFFEDVKIYEKRLGRSLDYRAEIPYWEADYVQYDNRIAPGETVTEHYEFDASDVTGSVFVTAQLFYRRASKDVTKVYQLIDKPIPIQEVSEEVF